MKLNNHLSAVFERCKAENRAALLGYLTAGDPNVALSEQLMYTMAQDVDIIEIGMPFSDPMADGPVIQGASERALAAGTRMQDVLAIALKVRQRYPEIGIVLMGYANVPYSIGFATFAEQAKAAGVDGVLLVDIPAEESDICADVLRQHDLSQIMLLAPTSTEKRIQLAAKVGDGFIYYVSLAGITGAEMGDIQAIQAQLKLVRQHSDLPVCVGFGVKNSQQAAKLAQFADGVVVGSHFVRQITSNIGDECAMIASLARSVKDLAAAMVVQASDNVSEIGEHT
ncbi:MAG: tryptophan synthase subunit alpha [Mariprofundaceae bacterium]|nr:tryptophan synthase subunit alpha [Mariprofundaceae bacterium]